MLPGQGSLRGNDPRGEAMLAPDEVAAMVRLHDLGWGTKRIAGALGCSRNTVKRYLTAGGWAALRQPRRSRRPDGFEDWLAERPSTAATATWCARICGASTASRCRCARSNARWHRCAKPCGLRRGRPCDLRHRRASSCRSTSITTGSPERLWPRLPLD